MDIFPRVILLLHLLHFLFPEDLFVILSLTFFLFHLLSGCFIWRPQPFPAQHTHRWWETGSYCWLCFVRSCLLWCSLGNKQFLATIAFFDSPIPSESMNCNTLSVPLIYPSWILYGSKHECLQDLGPRTLLISFDIISENISIPMAPQQSLFQGGLFLYNFKLTGNSQE